MSGLVLGSGNTRPTPKGEINVDIEQKAAYGGWPQFYLEEDYAIFARTHQEP